MAIPAFIIIAIFLANPDKDERPLAPPDTGEDQHFCCDTVGPGDGKGGGEGCVEITKDHVGSCSAVLYCEANWTKQDGAVVCY